MLSLVILGLCLLFNLFTVPGSALARAVQPPCASELPCTVRRPQCPSPRHPLRTAPAGLVTIGLVLRPASSWASWGRVTRPGDRAGAC